MDSYKHLYTIYNNQTLIFKHQIIQIDISLREVKTNPHGEYERRNNLNINCMQYK